MYIRRTVDKSTYTTTQLKVCGRPKEQATSRKRPAVSCLLPTSYFIQTIDHQLQQVWATRYRLHTIIFCFRVRSNMSLNAFLARGVSRLPSSCKFWVANSTPFTAPHDVQVRTFASKKVCIFSSEKV